MGSEAFTGKAIEFLLVGNQNHRLMAMKRSFWPGICCGEIHFIGASKQKDISVWAVMSQVEQNKRASPAVSLYVLSSPLSMWPGHLHCLPVVGGVQVYIRPIRTKNSGLSHLLCQVLFANTAHLPLCLLVKEGHLICMDTKRLLGRDNCCVEAPLVTACWVSQCAWIACY